MSSHDPTDSTSISGSLPRHDQATTAAGDEPERRGFDRRLFLTRGSVAVAAAGVAATVPGFASSLASAEEVPAAAPPVPNGSLELSGPLVAHVRDLATGEIGLFSGTEEIVFHDPYLATALFNATR